MPLVELRAVSDNRKDDGEPCLVNPAHVTLVTQLRGRYGSGGGERNVCMINLLNAPPVIVYDDNRKVAAQLRSAMAEHERETG